MHKTRDELFQRLNGFKPVKRHNKKQGQSEWYYINPCYEDSDERGQINVADEQTTNPQLKNILVYDIIQNPDNYYIWRTKGDNKVRHQHIEREGKIFNKHIPPKGGNPGEDYNCRCKAEPFVPNNHSSRPIIIDISGLAPENKQGTQHINIDNEVRVFLDNEIVKNNKQTINFCDMQKLPKYRLGLLNEKEEADNNPAAIGYDKDGGYSYGLYQIASNTGSMKGYLNFLAKSNDIDLMHYYHVLFNAGGIQGAKKRLKSFEEAWRKLSSEQKFNDSQKKYILSENYEPLLKKIVDIKGLNIGQRHPVVQDVLYSMATQHYRADIPIHKALGRNSDISKWSDDAIINAIYKARSEYVKNLNMNDKKAQYNIINYRYPRENKRALELLRQKFNGLY